MMSCLVSPRAVWLAVCDGVFSYFFVFLTRRFVIRLLHTHELDPSVEPTSRFCAAPVRELRAMFHNPTPMCHLLSSHHP